MSDDIYTGTPGDCRLCEAKNVECCVDGNCRACHISCSWEDCMDGTWNVASMVSRRTAPAIEGLKSLYPHARQWKSGEEAVSGSEGEKP